MTGVTFDTHAAVEHLIKRGIKKQHAEAFVETLQQSREFDFNQLATKDYIDARLESTELRLDSKLHKMKNELLIWLLGTFATSTATIIGFLIYLK